ncbi:MAG: multicopper oxidase domain-containing protein, partial [Actinobacteria bacterium]|nr:multicopper oxidase domain-containing protein [Actinomycetota bacterium]
IQTKLLIGAIACAAVFAGSVPTSAQNAALLARRPQVCDDPTNDVTLFAENLSKGRIGYGLTPESASVPGPTLVMTEGDCLQVTLVNDSDRKLSTHYHGVDYTVASDGTPLNSSCVAPGRTRSYVIQAHAPTTRTDGSVDPGSAGYWHYHDHCLGTPHGTGGIYKGLFGALVVKPATGYMEPVRRCVLVMIKTTFNLKTEPKTPHCTSNLGDRVEFIVIGHGDLLHTFHLHGHRWPDNRLGVATSVSDSTRVIDNKVVGPADSFGFQVIAGERVGPGAWMYHCHVQGHSDAGMAGTFIVRTEGGLVTQETKDALEAMQEMHREMHHEN